MLQQRSCGLFKADRIKTRRKCLRRIYCQRYGEKLKIVFVGTEVAPWSKVGGLADVMSALPIALASEGHDVMTVVPRYSFYKDVQDTGMVVPLLGRTKTSNCVIDKLNKHSRLHFCKKNGVDRVFVEHPSFYGSLPSNSQLGSSDIYPYDLSMDVDFEVRYSVLCQTAIKAPFMIWRNRLRSGFLNGNGVRNGSQREIDQGGVLNHGSKMNITNWNSDNLIFVCNDWPCALLPAWIKILTNSSKDVKIMLHNQENDLNGNNKKHNLLHLLRDQPSTVEMPSEILQEEIVSLMTGSKMRALQEVNQTFLQTPSRVLDQTAEGVKPGLHDRMEEKNVLTLQHSKVVFLIHNFEFAGPNFHPSIQSLGLSEIFQSLGHFESEEDNANWLEKGMLQSDSIVTVSPGYAAEIQTKLRTLQNASLRDLEVIGITSGIDTDVWNPSKDSFIPPSMHFTFLNIFSHKKRGKTYLQRRLGLKADEEYPLFGFIGRLDHQKGVDILLTMLLRHFEENGSLQAQFILLGCGDPVLERHLQFIQFWFPEMAVGIATFSEKLAHEIIYASDFLLVPSRFEPCGLVAFSALRYGTIPICPAIGGLKEIVETDRFGFPPLGIRIEQNNEDSFTQKVENLKKAIQEASQFYTTREFCERQRRCMFADVSWNRPVQEWQRHLRSLLPRS